MVEVVNAFFSYAHSDQGTAPALFRPLVESLENLVNSRLLSSRLAIWRDVDGLRTGDNWDERIEERLLGSDILIIMLSPAWLKSAYCRKEYSIFREHEPTIGEYVVPILTRTLDRQVRHFTEDQSKIVDSLYKRQYFRATAPEFLALSSVKRRQAIEKLADDIEGMVERVCQLRPVATTPEHIRRPLRKLEFSSAAHNYRDVDFVSHAEVAVAESSTGAVRDVFAQVSFAERLFLECPEGRVEFGVKRAYLSIWSTTVGALTPSDQLHGSNRLVTWREEPDTLTICIEPPPGRQSLAELSLSVSNAENFYSKVGRLDADIPVASMGARIMFNISAEGLTFFEPQRRISATMAAKIGAVMAAALAKEKLHSPGSLVSRTVPVRSRLT